MTTNPARPPGPQPGLAAKARFLYGMATDAVGTVGARFDRYGDVYYVPNDEGGLYVLKHPEHLRQVLMTQAARFDKSHTAMQRMQEYLGVGLLTTDGDLWRRHRKLLQPAFNKKAVDSYTAVMLEEAARTAEDWQTGGTRDVSAEMMALTLRIVSRALFSHDVRAATDTVGDAMTVLNDSVGRPQLAPDWLPTPGRRRTRLAMQAIDDVIAKVIGERRAMSADQAPSDLLQALLLAADDDGALDEREIRDHLVTLYLAGHETTSHALTWTWLLLAQNPAVEERLHAHLHEALGQRAPTVADVPALGYVEQVLKESMRLYPPAYAVSRRALEDVDLGDAVIEAGAEVMIWIYHTHHDARWWPEPEAFRPERFAPGADEDRPRCAWLPFGAGPRACIGARFAMVEATLLLAHLAQRFRLRGVGAPPKMRPRVTLGPAGGAKMRITPRPSPGT